jgi:hypothetical protein
MGELVYEAALIRERSRIEGRWQIDGVALFSSPDMMYIAVPSISSGGTSSTLMSPISRSVAIGIFARSAST